MVDRDVRRTRRVVKHATLPQRPAEPPNGIPATRIAPGAALAPARRPVVAPAEADPAATGADSVAAPEQARASEPAAAPGPASPAGAPEQVAAPERTPAAEQVAAPGHTPAADQVTAPQRMAAPEQAHAAAQVAAPGHTPAPEQVAPGEVAGLPTSRPESPYGFPTEALLADHVAAADELRADLDRLRRQLDTAPPPLTPVRRRRHRPLLGVLVVGGTLGAIATATLVPWSNLDLGGSSTSQQATPGTRSGAGQVAARPGAAPSGGSAAPTAAAPRPAPPGSLPASGPGIDRPGTMQVVQVADDGTLEVTEQAVLGPRGLRDLNLRLPSMASLGGQVAELSPSVHDLRVAVNGTPVTPVPTADGPGWAVTSADGTRARTVQLSYRITDAVVRSRRSDSGRALGVSLPLLGEALRQQGLPLIVKTEGAGVGGVTCPSAPTAKMLCGTETETGWTADVPVDAANPTVLIQLDLA